MDKQNQIIINCQNLNETLEFFIKELGFRLDVIFPADAPKTAIISGYGKTLQLQESAEIAFFNEIPIEIPASTNEFVLTKNEGDWHTGRAGMQYRDLIPSRLGGKYIASHIRIPTGGKVPDYVHYHKVRFQMIYCLNGWATLVYEDQGAPFLMNAGDCVLQPPEIRHRVLECSDAFEVLEIGCPAIHPTFAEHEFGLPTENFAPDRIFNGQKFVHHIAEKVVWTTNGDFTECDTGIFTATNGLANVHTLRAIADTTFNIQHSDDFLFYFVKKGNLRLADNENNYELNTCCSFVLPKERRYLIEAQEGLELIRVNLPK